MRHSKFLLNYFCFRGFAPKNKLRNGDVEYLYKLGNIASKLVTFEKTILLSEQSKATHFLPPNKKCSNRKILMEESLQIY